MTNKIRFRCTKCYGTNVKILKFQDFTGVLKPIGICQTCGKRKDLDQRFLSLANQFFDHKEADKLRKIKQISFEYMSARKDEIKRTKHALIKQNKKQWQKLKKSKDRKQLCLK